ncbi:MAG: hypothetical protein ACXWUN_00680 [Allosphingosinicella sp.]
MPRLPALLATGLALASCGGGEPVPLDIASIESARSVMFPVPDAAPGAVTYNVNVGNSQLEILLARRGRIELRVFDCAAPDGPGINLPVYFGGEAVNGLLAQQVSSDREMDVQLSVAVPPAAGDAPRCARFVGLPGIVAPEVVSRPVPLPVT